MNSRLKKGLTYFKNFTYKKYEKLFHTLNDHQYPHTLFVACSDSRVSPEMLTNSVPGEVFTIRNIANTIPSFNESHYDLTTMAAIEYAIQVLNVEQIIVCGHSNCGGCAAALTGTKHLLNLPYTQKYLEPLEGIREIIEEKYADKDALTKATLMEKVNAAEQLKHLYEYPEIRKRIDNGKLIIEAWHYDIGSGTILVYDEKEKSYQLPDE